MPGNRGMEVKFQKLKYTLAKRQYVTLIKNKREPLRLVGRHSRGEAAHCDTCKLETEGSPIAADNPELYEKAVSFVFCKMSSLKGDKAVWNSKNICLGVPALTSHNAGY